MFEDLLKLSCNLLDKSIFKRLLLLLQAPSLPKEFVFFKHEELEAWVFAAIELSLG